MREKVLILGAGLSGLCLAYQLHKSGIKSIILEGRDRIGGRIRTIQQGEEAPVEMGATWLWEDNRELFELLKEFDIPIFQQYNGNTAFVQSIAGQKPEAVPLPPQEPSYRLVGGTYRLIQSLKDRLGADVIFTGQPVQRIEQGKGHLKVVAKDTFESEIVVVAAPPKLIVDEVTFYPQLPDELIRVATETQTWMEESIKVALTYETPFWKTDTTTLFSQTGPVIECYDHSDSEDKRYALCGFMHPEMYRYPSKEREQLVVQQLTQIYGEKAAEYLSYQDQVWRAEPFSGNQNFTPLVPHQHNGHPVFQKRYFDGKLFFANTETSPIRSGYMEGAVLSAKAAAEKILKRFSVEI